MGHSIHKSKLHLREKTRCKFVHCHNLAMINGTALLLWFHNYIRLYNLFVPEEDDYEDDGNGGALLEPATLVQHQRYATYLYVVLLIGKFNKRIMEIDSYSHHL